MSTHEIAKNSVVVTTSRLFTSIAKSLRSTSHAVRTNISGGPDERAVAGAQPRRRRLVGHQAAAAHERDARDAAVCELGIVRRGDDDRAARGARPEPVGDDAGGAIVEAGERLVEQHEPRTVQ